MYNDLHLLDLRRTSWIYPSVSSVIAPARRDGHSMINIDEVEPYKVLAYCSTSCGDGKGEREGASVKRR